MATAHTPSAALRVNQAYQSCNAIGRETLYLNWGLWQNDTHDLDQAARTLILRLGQMAGVSPAMRLLDVGFGFGDQLLDWCQQQGLRHGEGLNICPEQTETARLRLAGAGLSEHVQVQVGDAIALPFPAESFDAVTAVECAFHFRSRAEFFAEAQRVLQPSGRLVLADFIGTPKPSLAQKLGQWIASHYWGFAPHSFCSEQHYRELLLRAGFDHIEIEQVTDRVIPPGMRHARRRIWDADLRQRMRFGTWLATLFAVSLSGLLGDPPPGEYILVRAERR